ncbi:hypothetical protein I3842_13G128700 [Carya illinoinensis]|uniref:Uncharacterized protein n=1 Tax=Carya illinoinensis TaxID=32201 RepID=A0A922DBR9_CARIL|nr:hypothetical protein I3842_13G128700 [Carya illinoinensis]
MKNTYSTVVVAPCILRVNTYSTVVVALCILHKLDLTLKIHTPQLLWPHVFYASQL